MENTPQQNLPLYPEEAYKNQEQKSEEKPSQNFLDNPLIPLLLTSLQQGDSSNNDMLSKMLGAMTGGNNKLVEMLASSLNTKKNKKEVPKETSSKPFPKNEYF